MLHMHIASWVLLIILFFAAYFNFSEKQGATPYFKPIHMLLRLFMVLVLISGFWIWIQAFGDGNSGGHMLLTLKMICGVAVVALMEVTVTKRKRTSKSWYDVEHNCSYYNHYHYWGYFTARPNHTNVWYVK